MFQDANRAADATVEYNADQSVKNSGKLPFTFLVPLIWIAKFFL
jgi:hypothetical protein